jgi:hypothetical protein
VKTASVVIQRLWKTKLTRKRFLILRFLSIWLQSICRRILAKRKANRLVVSRMLNEEKSQLSLVAEIEAANVHSLPFFSNRFLSSGFIRNGAGRFDRYLIAYDIHFDISFSYPEGIMNTGQGKLYLHYHTQDG